jgi:hypothetical protein
LEPPWQGGEFFFLLMPIHPPLFSPLSPQQHDIPDLQFFRNANQPLKAWSVVSFDRFTDVDEMKRYMVYLMGTLESHGVKIANKAPTLVGPINPLKEQDVRAALQTAARAAFKAGGCAPQLIFVILPGRSASLSAISIGIS